MQYHLNTENTVELPEEVLRYKHLYSILTFLTPYTLSRLIKIIETFIHNPTSVTLESGENITIIKPSKRFTQRPAEFPATEIINWALKMQFISSVTYISSDTGTFAKGYQFYQLEEAIKLIIGLMHLPNIDEFLTILNSIAIQTSPSGVKMQDYKTLSGILRFLKSLEPIDSNNVDIVNQLKTYLTPENKDISSTNTKYQISLCFTAGLINEYNELTQKGVRFISSLLALKNYLQEMQSTDYSLIDAMDSVSTIISELNINYPQYPGFEA